MPESTLTTDNKTLRHLQLEFSSSPDPPFKKILALAELTELTVEEVNDWFRAERQKATRSSVPQSALEEYALSQELSKNASHLRSLTKRGRPPKSSAASGNSIPCLRCKVQKRRCDNKSPCQNCLAQDDSKANTTDFWKIFPCFQGSLNELTALFIPESTRTHDSRSGRPAGATSFISHARSRHEVYKALRNLLLDQITTAINQSGQMMLDKGARPTSVFEGRLFAVEDIVWDNDLTVDALRGLNDAVLNLAHAPEWEKQWEEGNFPVFAVAWALLAVRLEKENAGSKLKTAFDPFSLLHTSKNLLMDMRNNLAATAGRLICHITIESQLAASFFAESEASLRDFLRDLGEQIESRKTSSHEEWLHIFCALCLFSIAKSILVDFYWSRRNPDENDPSVPATELRLDSAYKAIVALFAWSSKGRDLLSIPLPGEETMTLTERSLLEDIRAIVRWQEWDDWKIRSSRDFLINLGSGLRRDGTCNGFWVQQYQSQKLTEPTPELAIGNSVMNPAMEINRTTEKTTSKSIAPNGGSREGSPQRLQPRSLAANYNFPEVSFGSGSKTPRQISTLLNSTSFNGAFSTEHDLLSAQDQDNYGDFNYSPDHPDLRPTVPGHQPPFNASLVSKSSSRLNKDTDGMPGVPLQEPHTSILDFHTGGGDPQRKRRGYDPRRRIEVAETRKVGACVDCRKRKRRCPHVPKDNLGVDLTVSTSLDYDLPLLSTPGQDVDMNNSKNLEFYSQMVLFRNDHTKNHLLFQHPSILEQRDLQLIAEILSLNFQYSRMAETAIITRPDRWNSTLDIPPTQANFNPNIAASNPNIAASRTDTNPLLEQSNFSTTPTSTPISTPTSTPTSAPIPHSLTSTPHPEPNSNPIQAKRFMCCPGCGYQPAGKPEYCASNLARHRRYCKAMPQNRQRRVHICPFPGCGRRFTRPDNLRVHVNRKGHEGHKGLQQMDGSIPTFESSGSGLEPGLEAGQV